MLSITRIRLRTSFLVLVLGFLGLLTLTACGIESAPVAARPRATTISLTTPTVFAVIDVTPVTQETLAGDRNLKAIPPAIDTESVILEPRVDLVQDAWRQYLSDAHVTAEDGSIDWTICGDGTALFTDQARFEQTGKWRILNTPRSFEWYQAVLGTYGADGSTIIAVLSMASGRPDLIFTDWQDVPNRGRAPSNDPLPLSVSVLDDHSTCAGSR